MEQIVAVTKKVRIPYDAELGVSLQGEPIPQGAESR
jgi:hypothetical protein